MHFPFPSFFPLFIFHPPPLSLLPTHNGIDYERGMAAQRVRQKANRENAKSCSSMSDVRWLYLSNLAPCKVILFLELIILPTFSSQWQILHVSDMYNILGYPKQSRPHFYSFMQ